MSIRLSMRLRSNLFRQEVAHALGRQVAVALLNNPLRPHFYDHYHFCS